MEPTPLATSFLRSNPKLLSSPSRINNVNVKLYLGNVKYSTVFAGRRVCYVTRQRES